MLGEKRRNEIIEIVNEKGSIKVSELSEEFNVTDETIRTDLKKLSNMNFLKRIHGGAVTLKKFQEISYNNRMKENIIEKRKIAQKAIKYIDNGDIIYLDISTTVMYLAKEILRSKDNVTIITNSARMCMELAQKGNITLISTGGILRNNSYSYVGPVAINSIKNYYADKFFASCKGVSLEYNITDSNSLECELKKMMLERSEKSYLLTDYTKFSDRGLCKFANLNEVDFIISDNKLKPKISDLFKKEGYNIY